MAYPVLAGAWALLLCELPGAASAQVFVLQGQAGPEGAPGAVGVPCHDGLGDVNGDQTVDVLDCRGAQGPPGETGLGWPPGIAEEDIRSLDGEFWCFRECPAAVAGDCRVYACDPVAYTCEPVGSQDGACPADQECDPEIGSCVLAPVDCAGQCPAHPRGWAAACNARRACEYRPPLGLEAQTGVDVDADLAELRAEIFIPAGSFWMGQPGREVEVGDDNEAPQHRVTFGQGFFVAKYEIAVAWYDACQTGEVCSAPSVIHWDSDVNPQGLNTTANGRGLHPQNGINWFQAGEYCAWIGGRLPAEAEWEYAAVGPVHRLFPWGEQPPGCDRAVGDLTGGKGCGSGGTRPVLRPARARGASHFGALDMVGNLAEWVLDGYHASYDGAPADGSAWAPADPGDNKRVLRGASWWDPAAELRSAQRTFGFTTGWHAGVGARCVRPLP
ncbi:MAG: formylglycine-generating enzyme family protein [Myxococcota bacterium]|jgi:formylglycine-generating enzyme required for sulfatase activity|nr:formylglycine-generating enzyme family protein [Myxococcota bacterium]